MKGICLHLYTYEKKRHKGLLLFEWILESAKQHGLQGGSATKALAGFGRKGIFHEEHFFELGNDVPVHIELITDEKHADDFLLFLKKEGLSLFFTKTAVEMGTL
jgi:PII-like signaling protein